MKKVDLACIIDDDPIHIYGTKKIMQMAGFCDSFLVYNNGKRALEGLRSQLEVENNVPDIILLDLNMPVMDGWEFLDEFIKLKTSKIISLFIVSSSINPVDLNRVNEYKEVKNFIIKPISVNTIADMASLLEMQ